MVHDDDHTKYTDAIYVEVAPRAPVARVIFSAIQASRTGIVHSLKVTTDFFIDKIVSARYGQAMDVEKIFDGLSVQRIKIQIANELNMDAAEVTDEFLREHFRTESMRVAEQNRENARKFGVELKPASEKFTKQVLKKSAEFAKSNLQ